MSFSAGADREKRIAHILHRRHRESNGFCTSVYGHEVRWNVVGKFKIRFIRTADAASMLKLDGLADEKDYLYLTKFTTSYKYP